MFQDELTRLDGDIGTEWEIYSSCWWQIFSGKIIKWRVIKYPQNHKKMVNGQNCSGWK